MVSVHSQRGLTAATKPQGVRLGCGYLMDGEPETTSDSWAACGAEAADRARQAGERRDHHALR